MSGCVFFKFAHSHNDFNNAILWLCFCFVFHFLVNSNIKNVPQRCPSIFPASTDPSRHRCLDCRAQSSSQQRDLKPFSLFICQQQLLEKMFLPLFFFLIIINKQSRIFPCASTVTLLFKYFRKQVFAADSTHQRAAVSPWLAELGLFATSFPTTARNRSHLYRR